MADPIEAHYAPDGEDWTVEVKGRGRTLTGRAPGLIAARDRADQLAEELSAEDIGHSTVVHMLNGDALEFTEAYLTARLARTDEPSEPEPNASDEDTAAEAPQPDEQAPAAEQTSTDDAPPTESDATADPDHADKPNPATGPNQVSA